MGIGGAGCHVVDKFGAAHPGIRTVACNTDEESLARSTSREKILLEGYPLGTGEVCMRASAAAIAAREKIVDVLDGTDTLVVFAALGGGTGTGAVPVVSLLAALKGVRHEVLLATPLSSDGEESADAEACMKAVGATADRMRVIDSMAALSFPSGGKTWEELFTILDEWCMAGIMDIISGLPEGGKPCEAVAGKGGTYAERFGEGYRQGRRGAPVPSSGSGWMDRLFGEKRDEAVAAGYALGLRDYYAETWHAGGGTCEGEPSGKE